MTVNKKWYVVEYFHKGNGMTYRTPIQATSKATALARYGTLAERRGYMKNVKVTSFK